jgi:hypothetical protein
MWLIKIIMIITLEVTLVVQPLLLILSLILFRTIVVVDVVHILLSFRVVAP